LSVSRVGSSAQTKAMKKVASRLRLELAQFRELQAFVQFASDLDEATKKKIDRGQMLMEVLKQMDLEPIGFERQVVVLYAAINGYLDDIARNKIGQFEKEFVAYLAKMHDNIFQTIGESGDIAPETEEKLKEAINGFKQIFESKS